MTYPAMPSPSAFAMEGAEVRVDAWLGEGSLELRTPLEELFRLPGSIGGEDIVRVVTDHEPLDGVTCLGSGICRKTVSRASGLLTYPLAPQRCGHGAARLHQLAELGTVPLPPVESGWPVPLVRSGAIL
ncbi:MAG: hypothetical protein BMS9Abin12_1430 [Acidimicrobiia bacterium]|nr:MAG: hypothetical protein BMS9Abin12_1430 [Acidimicrobiia bacterium]